MPLVEIKLSDVSKKFGTQWLFKNQNLLLTQHKTYALTGNNGSGKSTLLQIIYGYQSLSRGTITYQNTNETLNNDEFIKLCSFVAPYIDLPEEFTLVEQLKFHFSFKPLHGVANINELIDEIGLSESKQKKIKHFSSGMKQRVKLAQAFFSKTNVWLFDEPCTNLDENGINWYRKMVQKAKPDKLIVIASNQKHEYDFADEIVTVKR